MSVAWLKHLEAFKMGHKILVLLSKSELFYCITNDIPLLLKEIAVHVRDR